MRTLHCRPPGATATTVLIGHGLRKRVTELAEAEAPATSQFTLADAQVLALFPDLVPADSAYLALAGGEASKNLGTLEEVLRAMAGGGLDRRSRLVALGGGTIGDLGGFAAAVFLRGVSCVQVPTTLLAMVDSSIGGKTAVNLPEGKNLVGAFHPPSLAIQDMEFLPTLPDDQFLSGLGEVLKMAIGLDSQLFELLEQQREAVLSMDPEVLAEVVARSVQAKIDVVEKDLSESGPRRVLNLGHTYGHALEALSSFRLVHGLAIAQGIHVALDMAADRGLLEEEDRQRCANLLTSYGFEPGVMPPADELMPFLSRDKKVEGGVVNMVLPTGAGSCEVVGVALTELGARSD